MKDLYNKEHACPPRNLEKKYYFPKNQLFLTQVTDKSFFKILSKFLFFYNNENSKTSFEIYFQKKCIPFWHPEGSIPLEDENKRLTEIQEIGKILDNGAHRTPE